MKWFEGGIPQAIQAAKNNKSVFIVFITAEDEASSQMESYLHRQDVTGLCETNKCVAVKLVSASNDCTFFSQIFPVVVIPSTFFIGDSGTPLEVIGECTTPENFMEKVKAAITLQQTQSAQTQQSPPTQQQPQQQQQGASASPVMEPQSSQHQQPRQQALDESTMEEEEEEAVGAVGGRSEESGSGDEVSPEKKARTDDLSMDDRVERAKELIREKQEEKMVKQSEDAKTKEKERRSMGQGVQQLRQTQKEMDMLEAKKELRKDKEDDKIARQRVKEQIARDRAEKNARFNEAKAERDRAADESKKRKLMEQQEAAAAEQARRSDIARIQFRLPDGSSLTHQFPATDTFASLHQFITGHMGCVISLSTTFPRRTFTEADHSSSLQDLALAPSAVIMVIPGNRARQGVTSASSLSITSILFSPFMLIWNFLASIFGLSSSSSSSSASSSSSSPPAKTTTAPSATGGDRDPGSARQRDSSSRQQGAIHRFRNAEDDEDDEDRATWNGNSTQQM